MFMPPNLEWFWNRWTALPKTRPLRSSIYTWRGRCVAGLGMMPETDHWLDTVSFWGWCMALGLPNEHPEQLKSPEVQRRSAIYVGNMAWSGQWIRNQAALSTCGKGSLERSIPGQRKLKLHPAIPTLRWNLLVLRSYFIILITIPHSTTCSLFGSFHLPLHTILIHWSINCEDWL